MYVKPKKKLGQHFLRDQNIAEKIVSAMYKNETNQLLEIGPGTGVLSNILEKNTEWDCRYIEVDPESVEFLKTELKIPENKIILDDYLKLPYIPFDGSFNIIGNFPYNISSQLFFKILEQRNQIPQVVCMVQKEVAQRIASPPGSKVYGILSVLLQAYYDVKLLFTVPPGVFEPPPKVQSAVMHLTRNQTKALNCDEKLFVRVVKAGFNQRRKTLRNSLKTFLPTGQLPEIFSQRPEQLSVEEFTYITNFISQNTPL